MSDKESPIPKSSEVDRMEHKFLVGRDQELDFFHNRLHTTPSYGGIINLVGTSGVGKSYLLKAFRRISVAAQARFLLIDCSILPRNAHDVCVYVLHLFHYPVDQLQPPPNIDQLTELCIETIRSCANGSKLIVALDTFEAIGESERWLREELLPRLIPDILVVISGRFPLQGAWLASPGWRSFISRMPLAELDYEAVKVYLELSGMERANSLPQIWSRTKGHPLTLSLLVSTMLVGSGSQTVVPDDRDLFMHVVSVWLQEVPDADMRELVEAAAVLRHFNHEQLNNVLGRSVTNEQFRQLISYSFVQRVDQGWLLHDLLRDAIGSEFRLRSPDLYSRLWLRSAAYYADKIKRHRKHGIDAWENAEILYYIANHFIQFLLNRQSISYSLEQLHPANWAEAEHYLEQRKLTAADGYVPYVDSDTKELASYFMTARESLSILNRIQLKELFELDPACVKLIRNEKGTVYGLIVSIPINALTMPYLRASLVSAAYFNQLSDQERQALCVPGHTISGYFVQTVDVYDYFDPSVMQAAISTFITYILTAGYIVASPTANPVSDSILFGLGMEKKQEIVHYDYDGMTPTPYYVMDTRGTKIVDYMKKMIASFGLTIAVEHEQPFPDEHLSPREREVVKGVMKGSSNKEIARELFLSEATVKKHLTHIFEKLHIKNRVQLLNLYNGGLRK